MTRERRIKKARELSAKGWNNRQIGERLGVSTSAVWRWLHPDTVKQMNRRDNLRRRSEKREWENAHRANCEDCGCSLGAGSTMPSRSRPSGKCPTCWALSEAERIDPRRRQVEEWWADGLTMREICERLGWTMGHLCMEIHRMREAGYALPYRNRGYDRFPDQVAA